MNNWKRILALCLAAVMVLFTFTACTKTEGAAEQTEQTDEGAVEAVVETVDGEKELDVVKMAMPAPMEGMDHVAFEVAYAMGYFEEEGIDLMMETALGTNTAKMMASGQYDVGYVAPTLVMAANNVGIELKMFFNYVSKNFFGLAVRADSGIETLEDMAGKPMAYLMETDRFVLEPMFEAVGMDPDSVEWVLAGESRASMLEEGSADIAYCWATEAALWNAKFPVKFFSGDEYVKVTANGLAAMSDLIESEPDLLVRLSKALAKGMYFCVKNPDAATQILITKYPSLATNEQGIHDAVVEYFNQTDIVENPEGFFFQTGDRWETNAEINIHYENLDEGFDANQCWTNEIAEQIDGWDIDGAVADAEAWTGIESCRIPLN